jgi:hypothetical protein
MKKIILALLIGSQAFADMGEAPTEKTYNKHKRERIYHSESNESVQEPPEDSGKKFYKALFQKVQKANPDWSKEEVLRYIEPLWYKKLELDKANANRQRPSLSNETEIKRKQPSN